MVEKCMVMNAASLKINRKESACIRFVLITIGGLKSAEEDNEWCPFLTSQLKQCQISDASHWLVSNEPTRQ